MQILRVRIRVLQPENGRASPEPKSLAVKPTLLLHLLKLFMPGKDTRLCMIKCEKLDAASVGF